VTRGRSRSRHKSLSSLPLLALRVISRAYNNRVGFRGGLNQSVQHSNLLAEMEYGHEAMAIAACFVFQREISRSVFWDFFDSIDPSRKSAF
jgi:hypothetical protein